MLKQQAFYTYFFTHKLTPLHLAIQSKNTKIVELLLQRPDIHINAKTQVFLFFTHIDVLFLIILDLINQLEYNSSSYFMPTWIN